MSRVKLIMSACVAVLAFSALMSGAASAAPAGWMVNGSTLGATGTAALAATAKVDQKGKLIAAGIEIECTGETITGLNPKINEANLMGEATSIGFTGCKSLTPTCKLASENINTLPLLIDVTLDGTLAVKGKFLTQTKNVFTTLKYESVGAEGNCVLEGINPVTGSANFLAHTGQDERTVQIILVSSEGEQLKVGSSAASISGSALLALANGQSWSFL